MVATATTPTTIDVYNYITDAARKRGVNPAFAHLIVRNEGGYNAPAWARPGDPTRGTSWGPFQLNLLAHSLGDSFQAFMSSLLGHPFRLGADTVIDTYQQQVDYSLDYIRAHPNYGTLSNQWFGLPRVNPGIPILLADAVPEPLPGPGPDPFPVPAPGPGTGNPPPNTKPTPLAFGEGVSKMLTLIGIGLLGAALILAGIAILGRGEIASAARVL